MQCPTCHGRHVIASSAGLLPCPECQGAGQLHCCDGLACQPGEDDFMEQTGGDGEAVAA